ncbi:hypothetical protein WICMUC_001080 [Wickerhamomyces mucosus]|uniref:Uncharacterized protein n=1 Tax=Wickerhamomyces mucosus TaxID=1378264 RepID=A0A9P8THZ9_9ASCO|nr:hypothetical protein WICMUC_001080 [Wickerhamomyces mucosus]
MKFFKSSTLSILILIASTVIASTTSYSPDELSSASSAAIAADITFIADFLENVSENFQTYLAYMEANNLQFPNGLYNYFAEINYASNQANFIETASFPFSEFKTFAPKFSEYSTLVVKDGTFRYPEDFLTGGTISTTTTFSSTTLSSSSDLQITSTLSSSTEEISRISSTSLSSFSSISSGLSSLNSISSISADSTTIVSSIPISTTKSTTLVTIGDSSSTKPSSAVSTSSLSSIDNTTTTTTISTSTNGVQIDKVYFPFLGVSLLLSLLF